MLMAENNMRLVCISYQGSFTFSVFGLLLCLSYDIYVELLISYSTPISPLMQIPLLNVGSLFGQCSPVYLLYECSPVYLLYASCLSVIYWVIDLLDNSNLFILLYSAEVE